jgi:hypothetical protein
VISQASFYFLKIRKVGQEMDFKELGWEVMYWVHLTQDKSLVAGSVSSGDIFVYLSRISLLEKDSAPRRWLDRFFIRVPAKSGGLFLSNTCRSCALLKV